MAEFQRVKTEYADGHYGGAIYGQKIRIVMRSPTAVMFIGYGVRAHLRSEHLGVADIISLSGESRVDEWSARAIEAIERLFGEGAAQEALLALTRRGTGTVLVDGGGAALPLPYIDQRRATEADYEAITPTHVLDVTVAACKQCGAPLTPDVTARHSLGPNLRENHPRTVEDCQRLTNVPIYAIRGYAVRDDREKWPYIESFSTWDGTTYVDPDFCQKNCAIDYARRAVRDLPLLPADGSKVERDRHRGESIEHFERETRTILVDGVEFKI